MMVESLFSLVGPANYYRISRACDSPGQLKEELENNAEKAKNQVKCYEYANVFYKNRQTTLIGDFFRHIGDRYFSFLTGKSFMSGSKLPHERSINAKSDIIRITFALCF